MEEEEREGAGRAAGREKGGKKVAKVRLAAGGKGAGRAAAAAAGSLCPRRAEIRAREGPRRRRE